MNGQVACDHLTTHLLFGLRWWSRIRRRRRAVHPRHANQATVRRAAGRRDMPYGSGGTQLACPSPPSLLFDAMGWKPSVRLARRAAGAIDPGLHHLRELRPYPEDIALPTTPRRLRRHRAVKRRLRSRVRLRWFDRHALLSGRHGFPPPYRKVPTRSWGALYSTKNRSEFERRSRILSNARSCSQSMRRVR